MARFNVGEAFLQVVASVSGIHEKIAAEVAKIRDIEIDVNPNMAGFREKVAAGLAGIQDVEIDVTPNLQGFREKVAAETANFRDVTVNVRADTAAAEAEIAALGSRSPTVHVNVDVDSARANIQTLTREVLALGPVVDGLAGTMSTKWGLIGTAILPAITSIGQLSGALGLIPAVATGVATALGAVVIGSQGLGEAFKAQAAAEEAATAAGGKNVAALQQQVTAGAAHIASLKAQQAAGQNVTAQLQAAETAQKANVSALNDAKGATDKAKTAADAYAASLTNLAPSARQFVSAVVQLKPAFEQLRLDVQQHLFQGIGDALLQLGRTALPVVRTGLTQMADGLSEAARNVASFASSKEAVAAYKTIFDNIGTAAHQLAGAVQPILQIFTDVAEVGSTFLPGLAAHFADAARNAAEFVRNAKETGQLKQWIQTGLDAVKELWGAFKDVVAIIRDLAASPGFGPNFLEALHAVTSGIRWFIENVPGATTLVKLFFDAWLFAKVIQGLTNMATTIKSVVTALGLLKAAEAGTAITGIGTAAEGAAVGLGRFSSALKVIGVLGGVYLAGQALLAIGNANTGKSFKDMAQDAEDTAGKLATFDFPGVVDKIGRDIKRLPEDLNTAGGRLKTAWGFIQDVFSGAVVGLTDSANKVGSGVREALTPLPGIVNGALGGLAPIINSAVSDIAANVGKLPPLMLASLSQLPEMMRAPVESAMGGLLPIITKGMQDITNNVQGLTPQVQAALAPLSPAMQQSANAALGGMLTVVNTGVANITAAVQGINTAVAGVPTAHATVFTGDPAQVLAAAQQSTGAIQGVPAQFLTTFLGEPGAVVAAAATAITQINGVPARHDTTLTAIDNASRVAALVRAAYAQIPQSVTTVITAIQRTVQGAEGMIWPGTAMAAGGVLPMASGGRLHPNMSASLARIVPPNTWRVIGDRPSGDEAFIPINHSARSVALLGVTANRMGFGLAPMRRGGYHSRDGRAWDWLEELLRRWRGGHGGGGSGGPKVAGTIGTSEMRRITSSLAFGGSGGAASYMRTVKAPLTQLLQPAPSVPSPPSHGGGGRGGRDGSRTVYVDSNSALVQEIMRLIRTEVRKQGGDVQVALGR